MSVENRGRNSCFHERVKPDPKENFWRDGIKLVPIENFIITQGEVDQRDADLAEFKMVVDELDLGAGQIRAVLTWAHGFWALLNPLRGDESTLRFNFWRERVNHDLRESNWQHSLLMLRKLADLEKVSHDLLFELDMEKIVKMILVHDAPEFLYGDMESLQQVEGNNLEVKKIREEQAARLISNKIDFGEKGIKPAEFTQIFGEYEKRESVEAALVKMLDIISGDEVLAREVIGFLSRCPEKYQEDKLGELLDKNYEVNIRKRVAGQRFLEEKLRARFGLSTNQEEAPLVNYGWQQGLNAILRYVEASPKQEQNWREEIGAE